MFSRQVPKFNEFDVLMVPQIHEGDRGLEPALRVNTMGTNIHDTGNGNMDS